MLVKGIGNVFDQLRIWQQRMLMVFNTIRLRLLFYKNIHFKGIENIHYSTQIYGRLKGEINLGKRISTWKNGSIVAVGGKLTIGDYTSFNENCSVVCHERIDIGKHCMFGPNVCVYDHDHKFGIREKN